MINKTRLLSASVLFGLAATITSPVAAQGSFTGYEHSIFGGTAWPFPLQAYVFLRNVPIPLPSGPNDDITSLQWNLQNNISLTFYHNSDGSGEQYHVGYTAPRVGHVLNVGATHNDEWSAFSWQLDDPTVGGTVTLFEDAGLGGIAKRLPLSSYDQGTVHELYGYNDKASSLSWNLQPNAVVTFYEHPDGTGREWTINHATLRNGSAGVLPSSQNDKWSSFRWYIADPNDGWVRLYEDVNYVGHELVRYVSQEGFGAFDFFDADMNDKITSLQWSVPNNHTILLFDKAPKGGACMELSGSGGRNLHLSPVFQDKLSTCEFLDGDYTVAYADRDRTYDQNTYIGANMAHINEGANYDDWHHKRGIRDILDYGARALNLETRINGGTIYMTDGDWAQTLSYLNSGGTPQTLASFVGQLESWMGSNPRQILTLIFENHDGGELADYLLDTSVIKDKIFVQDSSVWPTLEELLAMGKRYVVFETMSDPYTGRLPSLHDFAAENAVNGWQQQSLHPGSLQADNRSRGLFQLNNAGGSQPSTLIGYSPNDLSDLLTLAGNFSQIPNWINVDRINEWGEGAGDFARVQNTGMWPLFANRATYARFGAQNCGSRELEAVNRPLVGTTFDLSLDKAPLSPASAFEFLIVGNSDEQYGAAPLPMQMPAPFGLDCTLRVAIDIVAPLGLGGYPINVPVAIPGSPSLIGQSYFFQTAGLVLATNEYVMSDAGRAKIGTL